MPRPIAILARPATGLLLLGALALGACGSTGKASAAQEKGRALRITFVDTRSGSELELVDESHTSRTELYSKKRQLGDAGTKVTSDEVLEETVRYFREKGWYERATEGPVRAGAEATQTLEVEEPGRTTHLALSRLSTPADRRVFMECAKAFAEIYNATYQLQSVEGMPDWERGANPKPPKAKVP